TYAQLLGLDRTCFGPHPGCMEYLSISRPDLVSRIHKDYLEAGADAVETDTFGGNSLKLAEYGLSKNVYEVNLAATKLARSAADGFASSSSPRFVIGAMGPTGRLPSSLDSELGGIGYARLKEIYAEQAEGIIDGGADALLVETGQDLLEMKAAVNGAKEALKRKRKDLVIMAQCTLANNGRMLLGTEISAVAAVMGYLRVDVVGLNCSSGPAEMEGALRFLSERSSTFISCSPNAGLPVEESGKTVYPLGPKEMADVMARFVREYRLDVIGGCCGTGPEHIRMMRKALRRPRKRKMRSDSLYAGFYKAFDLKGSDRPVKIGERMNAQGSRRMKELLKAEDYDGIVEIGKHQQASGAGILDICSVLTERATEKRDSVIITRRLAESVQVPLMIDSTDIGVIKAALESYPGTAFINSVNLEDRGVRAREVFGLAAEHGSFIVCLAIDENGMAKTAERKLEIAERLYDIAVRQCRIEPHRLLFDALTFTLGTGEEEYVLSAVETYKAIKSVKKDLAGMLTVLGVSNVSFGLSKETRGILNMVFLYHAVRAGLDMAIMNPAEFMEYKNIPAKERRLAEDLVFARRAGALGHFIEHFTGRERSVEFAPESAVGIEEKIRECVFERNKSGIIPLLDEALKKHSAEKIINDILMEAMKEVGERLERGQTVLPYVLQSAEVMRKAVTYLEKFLSDTSSVKRGKVLLATVSGDVHDIGKNLVKILLRNNGFSVIDLGKQVSVEKIVTEAEKNKPDAVGLSALLVSTARHMKTCVQSMQKAGLAYPILIGGAPTNKQFAKDISVVDGKNVYPGGVFYARDAFTGLALMRALTDPGKKKEALDVYHKQFNEARRQAEKNISRSLGESAVKSRPERRKTMPVPPFYGIRTVTNIPVDDVMHYLDKRMLFELAWGARLKNTEEKKRLIREEYEPLLQELKEEVLRRGWLTLKAVYGYFKCRASDGGMDILDESGRILEKLCFSGPKDPGEKDLADYFPGGPEGHDIVAFQAVTVGAGIADAVVGLEKEKNFTRAFFLHGMSVHLAEALAAYMHDRIRSELKLKKGQGRRYSPGYPSWRRMEEQEKIFRLLDVQKRLNIRLTDGYQIIPEASTTAMIVYDDQAE
ncbi:MAG: homocysteine S-methyltransferase family protein, partial [Candidatus Omnitrophota bacterium]